MFKDNIVFKLSNDALIRYEANVQDGVCFLYNINNKELWTGNRASYDLISLIDGISCLKDIYKKVEKFSSVNSIDVVKDNVNAVFNELLSKEIIEII